MAENPGSVCDDLRELAEVHHAPRGNIAAVYFAITRKYGYTRLESELAHSINVYCRAVPRRIARAPSCNTPCTIDVCPPISWDFSGTHAHAHARAHTYTYQCEIVASYRRGTAIRHDRAHSLPPGSRLLRDAWATTGNDERFKNRDTRRVYDL